MKVESKETILDPLIKDIENSTNTQESHLSDFDGSTGKALLKIFNLSIAPIIGMIFHPMYHLINTMLLG